MAPKKYSVKEQRAMIPDADIHAAFLDREDIAPLTPDEQERRWQEHLVHLNKFREWLSGIPAVAFPVLKKKKKK